MSARIRNPLLIASCLILSSAVFAAEESKKSSQTEKAQVAAKTAAAERAVANAATQPAGADGSVSRALTELYRIPRPGQTSAGSDANRAPGASTGAAPRQFGNAGRGEAPRQAISEQNRMGYQHSDAIRNSVTTPPMSVGARPANAQPAVPVESSLTAHNWSPYPDPALPGGGDAMGTLQQDSSSDSEDYRFGFTEGYQYGRWAQRGGARVQSVLAHANNELSRGLAAFRSAQYRTAAKYFKLASDSNRGDPSAMIYSAHALFAIGRYQEAAAFLRKAFALEPRISLLTYDMRDDYQDKGEFEQQLRALNNAVVSSPRDLDRLLVLGYVHNYSDQPDRAFEVLNRARMLAPKDKLIQRLYESTNPPDVVNEKK